MRTYTFYCRGEDGFYSGHDPDQRQYLMGVGRGCVVTFCFSPSGDLLAVWEDRATDGSYPQMQDLLLTLHQIIYVPIKVKMFMCPAHHIHLRDLPAHYEAFHHDPDTVPPEKHRLYRTSITEWLEDENFVFLWGRCMYWGDGEGHLLAR